MVASSQSWRREQGKSYKAYALDWHYNEHEVNKGNCELGQKDKFPNVVELWNILEVLSFYCF